jgi:dolichol-phosphate mannosyltransferase
MRDHYKIAVVVPAYRVREHILGVLGAIGADIDRIYVVDDACPEGSGARVRLECTDRRVQVIFREANGGVGAAVMTGYQAAINDGVDIIVKVDGDGQMDPALIDDFVRPIIDGDADYAKGNRFFDVESVRSMPRSRLLGNAALSFMAKMSTGYWNLFDPTNGYTAIHADVVRLLPMHKISSRYFFETDLLFRLNAVSAVVVDVPMVAKYGNEKSNLRIPFVIPEFMRKHLMNLVKRIFYNYYLRDMSLASVELPIGVLMLLFGGILGAQKWALSLASHSVATAGTVMLAALPVILGFQLVMSFLSFDMNRIPRRPIHRRKNVRH